MIAMKVSELTEERLTDAVIDQLLFAGLKDEPSQKADCILVLGSTKATQYRVPVAVDAYRAGRAPVILMSGGACQDGTSATEAERMKQRALALGVPEEAILVETESRNTIENILFSLIVIQRHLWLNRVQDVLLVPTAFHMRRRLLLARYLFPAHLRIHPCPAEDRHTRPGNWRLTEQGRQRATAEALNLIRFVQNGVIPDFTIETA